MPRRKRFEKIESIFDLPEKEMRRIVKSFHSEMKKGLSGRKSSLKMIPTHIEKPTGNEKGDFLALDLGGTNFRILRLKLKGIGRASFSGSAKFVLPKRYVKGTGRALFDFIASCIKSFMRKNGISMNKKRRIGFTFSFPVKNSGANSGILIRWTKGFSASGVEGKDVVKLLNAALLRKGLPKTRVVALSNDTVSTLMAGSYEDPSCSVGVILGTGTNACYSEKISNIKKLKSAKAASGEMIVNMEWGNFNKLSLTPYDRALDKFSENPGEQALEKMVSGMYLGNLAGLAIKDLISKGILFEGKKAALFSEPQKFKTEYASAIEKDASGNLTGIKAVLQKLGIANSKYEERKLIKDVCIAVSTRAARVSAAAITSVATKINPRLSGKVTVAVDGTVYEKYHAFPGRIKANIKKILGRKAANVRLRLTKDASSRGAAVIAAL